MHLINLEEREKIVLELFFSLFIVAVIFTLIYRCMYRVRRKMKKREELCLLDSKAS